jgi:hypothetical protein
MTSNDATGDVTLLQDFAATVADGHDVDRTIAVDPAIIRRVARNPSADGIRDLGYEIGAELGRGGLGVVNVATQRVFARPVAVKRLLDGNGDDDAALKFFAEALVTAQLEHPHIVPIHDLMADEHGRLQLVMKRVDGSSWRDLLHPRSEDQRARASALGLDDHLDILLKVCDGVSFAHGRGILHRDLKPENVMVGAYGEVLVMDWGCAVAFGDHPQHPLVPRVEAVRHIAGTPTFMAPEMALIQADRLAPHSDVYQLGAVLYDVLTRRKPHRGDTLHEVLRDAVAGVIVHPSQAAPERAVPAELAEICLAALAKEPTERIATVACFSERLKDYRRHAQAVSLEHAARRHLAAAIADQRGADEALRKAVAAAEQACGIWPGWQAARQTVLDATLAWAEHHLTSGAAALAAMRADQAAAMAHDLGRGDLAAAAARLGARAATVVTAQAARKRQLRLTRIGLVAAGIVLVVGLASFLVVVSAAQNRTAAALAQSKRTLDALTRVQAARGIDQKTSAPALVAQARRAIASNDLDGALASLRIASGFDPTLVEAHQLTANVLAAAKRHDEAQVAAARWRDLAVGAGKAQAAALLELSRLLAQAPDEVAAVDAQVRLADLFAQQQLYILGETTAIPPAKRLELYRKRLDAAWPGISAAIIMRDDGRLVTDHFREDARGFRDRGDIADLEPIRGMPFASLSLMGTGIRNLDALAGMPLEDLAIDRTAVTDLSPLRGMRLISLSCSQTRIADLSPLAGMPLRILQAAQTLVSDLQPLHGMPLDYLHLGDCKVSDLSPLGGLPITKLLVGDRIGDLAPLRGMPLEYCAISGHGDLDLSPLAMAPLTNLSLRTKGTVDLSALPASLVTLRLATADPRPATAPFRFLLADLSLAEYPGDRLPDLRRLDASRLQNLELINCDRFDLAPLAGPRLAHLVIVRCGDFDLTPLAACPLTDLRLTDGTPTLWRSLAALRSSTTLATITFRERRATAAEFWARYRAEVLP